MKIKHIQLLDHRHADESAAEGHAEEGEGKLHVRLVRVVVLTS